MKQISSKRAKTDADHEELARLEFFAGLYLSQDGPVIPAHCIDAVLFEAAKKGREGPLCKAGVFCPQHVALEYDGPRTAEALWGDERFRDIRPVRVQNARIMRTRPIFNEWTATVEVSVEPNVVNPTRIDDWLTIAGNIVGLLEMRPKLGRFGVNRL